MADNKQTPQQGKAQSAQIAIQLDDDMAQGMYSNLMMVNHNENEFVLDFIFLQPQSPKAKVRARIIASPKHIKRLQQALQENIAKYESRFGAIEVVTTSPTEGAQFH